MGNHESSHHQRHVAANDAPRANLNPTRFHNRSPAEDLNIVAISVLGAGKSVRLRLLDASRLAPFPSIAVDWQIELPSSYCHLDFHDAVPT